MNKIDEWVNNGPGEGTLHYLQERGFDSYPIDDIGYESVEEALKDLNTITSENVYPGAVVLHGALDQTRRLVVKPSKISKLFPTKKAYPPKLYIESFDDIGFYSNTWDWTPIPNPYSVDTPNLRYFFNSGKKDFKGERRYWNYLLVVPKVYIKDRNE